MSKITENLNESILNTFFDLFYKSDPEQWDVDYGEKKLIKDNLKIKLRDYEKSYGLSFKIYNISSYNDGSPRHDEIFNEDFTLYKNSFRRYFKNSQTGKELYEKAKELCEIFDDNEKYLYLKSAFDNLPLEIKRKEKLKKLKNVANEEKS
jgi:hypothetical protein